MESKDLYVEDRDVLSEETGKTRNFRNFEKYLVIAVGLGWAIFQLLIPGWDFIESIFPNAKMLDDIARRCIHLAFGLALGILYIPISKRHLKFINPKKGISILDYILLAVAIIAALYYLLAREGIEARQGIPNYLDVFWGFALVIFLLEVTRRSIGPALSIIAIVFSAYTLLVHVPSIRDYFPEILRYKGASLTAYLSKISLSTEGIYGIPLQVSTDTVYLFVLFGALMQKAGAGKFFIDLALSILGRYKGGPAKAAIVSSGLTGMISGSSIANIVTTGTFTIPLMKKVGYPAKKAAAVEVAASTDGQLMPPIMGAAAFIIAAYLKVDYIDVVKAAFIPALVSYLALFYITHLEASKLGMRGLTKEESPKFTQVVKDGFHFLIPIGVLIYELVVARHSPSLSAFRAIGLMIAMMIGYDLIMAYIEKTSFKEALKHSVKNVVDGCVNGSKNMISVALATAAAGIIVGVVTIGIGDMITQFVEILAQGNIYLLLLITAIASLLLGMGLPTTATYIVMAALTAPIIADLGVQYGMVIPLMSAHLFCFYFGILADDTPPVGLASYAAAAIAQSEPIPTGLQGFFYDLRTAVIPFMFVFNTDLIAHHIDSWAVAILVFTMATMGAFAFTSALQGWLIIKNRWYDAPILLLSTFLLFNPLGLIKALDLKEDLPNKISSLNVNKIVQSRLTDIRSPKKKQNFKNYLKTMYYPKLPEQIDKSEFLTKILEKKELVTKKQTKDQPSKKLEKEWRNILKKGEQKLLLSVYGMDNSKSAYVLKSDLKREQRIEIADILTVVEYSFNYILHNSMKEIKLTEKQMDHLGSTLSAYSPSSDHFYQLLHVVFKNDLQFPDLPEKSLPDQIDHELFKKAISLKLQNLDADKQQDYLKFIDTIYKEEYTEDGELASHSLVDNLSEHKKEELASVYVKYKEIQEHEYYDFVFYILKAYAKFSEVHYYHFFLYPIGLLLFFLVAGVQKLKARKEGIVT